MRIASIYNNVTGLRPTFVDNQFNEVIDSLAGHDQKHHAAGLLELLDKLLDAVSPNYRLALGLIVQEAVDFSNGTIEGNDSKTMI